MTPVISQELVRYEFREQKMGTQFHIIFYAAHRFPADQVAQSVWERVDSLNSLFSDYEEFSEISRLSASAGEHEWIRVSDQFWEVLQFSQRLSEITSGQFDVTIGPLSKLWRRAIRQLTIPSTEEITQAKSSVGYEKIQMDSSAQLVRLTHLGMRLDMGGIAKGFTVDQISDFLKKRGIRSFLVDGGGDIYAADPPPGEAGWNIRMEAYERNIVLTNKAIAASGDSYKFLEIDGQRFAHIVDPRTGYGVKNQKTVYVTASDCMTADALATVFSISSSGLNDKLSNHFHFQILK